MSDITISTISLDGSVSRDEYKAVVERLASFMNELGNGWCSEQHRYFEAIIPEYSGEGSYGDASYELDFSVVPEDADYAARLRDVRARILWYTRARTIEIETADNGLRAAGLPGIIKDTDRNRYRVELPVVTLNVSGDNPEHWLRYSLSQVIRDLLDGRAVQDNRVVPGSVTVDTSARLYVGKAELNTTINAADTLRPDYC